MPSTDFNGDGRDDILWQSYTTGHVGTWLGRQQGGFTDNSAAFLTSVLSDWHIAATGDFNGDGYDDIAWWGWQQDVGMIGNWFGGPSGVFTINDHLMPIYFGQGYAADFDGDGRDELLSVVFTSPYSNDLDIIFSLPNGDFDHSATIAWDTYTWTFQGVGDFNGDGRADILWRNQQGVVGNWLASEDFSQSNPAFIVNLDSLIHVADPHWSIQAVGDYNGDGYADILWRHFITQNVGFWLGGEGGIFTPQSNPLTQAPSNYFINGSGDFNGDGIDDVLWRQWNTGELRTWYGSEAGQFNDVGESWIVPVQWLVMPDYAGRAEWL